MIKAGNKLFERCPYCGNIVCLNKVIFGSMHICISDEDKLLHGKRFSPLTEADIEADRKRAQEPKP